MSRIIESTSTEEIKQAITDNTVFMMFVLQPKDTPGVEPFSKEVQEPTEGTEPHWGIVWRNFNGKLSAKIGTAPTQRAAFDALLTALNLSTDTNHVLPFMPTDEHEWA